MFILLSGGNTKRVKNLGWILKNWKDVEKIIVEQSYKAGFDSYVCFVSKDGTRWSIAGTFFASSEVLRNWLNRPVFRGLECQWYGTLEKIGEK